MASVQHLSAVDIEAQLKDPNSYASKLYQAVVAQYAGALAVDKLLFQLFLESLVREELRSQQASRESSEETSLLGTAAANPVLVPVPGITKGKTKEIQALQAQLLQDLRKLLTVDQSTMTLPQLTQHHQAIMSNYYSQLALSIGPTVTLPSGTTLTVPPTTKTPPAPAVEVLARNEGLRMDALSSPDGLKIFATHQAQLSVNIVAPFNLLRDAKEASGTEYLSVKDIITFIERAQQKRTMSFLDQLTNVLRDNNYYSIKEQFAPGMEVDPLQSALNKAIPSLSRNSSPSNPTAHFSQSGKRKAEDLDAGISIVPSSKR